jgi:hypothetical protein
MRLHTLKQYIAAGSCREVQQGAPDHWDEQGRGAPHQGVLHEEPEELPDWLRQLADSRTSRLLCQVRTATSWTVIPYCTKLSSAGIIKQSIGARNRVGIGLSARQATQAGGMIPCN